MNNLRKIMTQLIII